MADVDSSLYQWSTTESSNKPTGGTTVGPGLDDNLRQIQATVRAWLSSKGADIASATTTDLGAVAGLAHDITGTTTITGFGTVAAGIWKILKFEGALTLTHNATSLILLGGENHTTADGDVGIYISEGSGNWRELAYFPVAINPAKMVSTDETQELTNKTLNASVGKGTWTASGTWTLPAVTLGGAITYGGVTLSNAVTGTGNMVLSASPTLTGTLTAAIANFSGAVATGNLAVTGTGTFTGPSGNGAVGRFTNGTGNVYMSFLSNVPYVGGDSGGNNAINFNPGAVTINSGGSSVVSVASTGLAVTGTVDVIGTAASTTASHLQLGSTTQSTIGANGAASALTANPLGYLVAYLGSTKIIIPYYNA